METAEKPLRIRLDKNLGKINKALCSDEFVKFANELVLDKIFEKIKTEVNQIERTESIFLAFTKRKLLSNERPPLKLSHYFEGVAVHFKMVVRKSKHVYFIEAHLDKAKIIKKSN